MAFLDTSMGFKPSSLGALRTEFALLLTGTGIGTSDILNIIPYADSFFPSFLSGFFTESLAGKLLFAARLLPGSPFPLISFSVVAHCSTFSHRNVVVIFTDRRWINSNIDVQMNRPLHSRLIKKAKQQLIRQVAWSEMPWMFRHGHHKYCNILTRCSQIMNIPWIVPASDFSVACFIFMPDSDSVTWTHSTDWHTHACRNGSHGLHAGRHSSRLRMKSHSVSNLFCSNTL